jgi:hypothetical protein
MYIMAPESISTAYFINPSHQYVCLYVLSLLGKGLVKCIPPSIARQRHGKHVPAEKKTHNDESIVGRVCLWVCRFISLSLLGNSSVKTSPRQQRIFGGLTLYALLVLTKESMRLVLPRASFFLWKPDLHRCVHTRHQLYPSLNHLRLARLFTS